jgi:hypothetical protein
VNKTTNLFVKNLERYSTGKLGIPAGVFSSGANFQKVEGYYKMIFLKSC